MLLTIDVGNTNIKIAVFDDDKQLAFSRFETKQADYRYYFEKLFDDNDLKGQVQDAIISCVVPELKNEIVNIANSLINNSCIVVDTQIDSGISIDTDNPDGVGSDLIVICAYAYHLAKQAVMVLSFGTANVLCYVDDNACFKYCIIAPGLLLQMQSLFVNAAKLPPFKLEKQSSCLSNQTVEAMNVGIIDGTIGATNYLIEQMKKELAIDDIKIIASGGLGKFIAPYLPMVDEYIPDLVTDGLKYLYTRLSKKD